MLRLGDMQADQYGGIIAIPDDLKKYDEFSCISNFFLLE